MFDTSKLGKLRRHQSEALAIARTIAMGARRRKFTVAHVTPGGGKSRMAAIFANVILREGTGADACDLVVVIVPNIALALQTVSQFHDPERGLTLQLSRSIKESRQRTLERRHGYCVTFQALAAKDGDAARRLLDLCQRHRVLLVIDEPHHLSFDALEGSEEEASADGRQWYEAIRPLVAAAKQVLLMSGTLYRHDRRPIPFVEYDEATKLPRADIVYDRREALEEKAVLPIELEMVEGHAQWDVLGRRYDADLSTAKKSRRKSALRTALATPSYTEEVLRRAVVHWRAYRRNVYASRLLVIVGETKEADAARDFLQKTLHVADCAVATSRSDDPQKTIRRFREGQFDALVTVGMAYEGLDVPDISHVAYLRTIRSIPWMSQAVERGARFDAGCGVPYDDQWCHVFCPDDAEMQAFVESIRAQCAQTVLERHERAAAAAAGRHRGIGIIPRAAEAKGSTWMTDAGDVARRAAGVVEKVRALDPAMRSISARAALKVGAMLDWSRLPNTEGE